MFWRSQWQGPCRYGVAKLFPLVSASGFLLCANLAHTAPDELFAAIDSGQIEVKVYPRDSRQVRLVVTNKTTQPLSIAMPEAFAAVPVLAQMGFMGGPPAVGTNSKRSSSKEPQPLGEGTLTMSRTPYEGPN